MYKRILRLLIITTIFLLGAVSISYADTFTDEEGITWTYDGTAITGCNIPEDGELVIPDEIDGFKMTAISQKAFYGTALEKVVIPGSIETIGISAFERCSNLTEVVLNDGLKEIGLNSFSSTAITEIYIPKTVTSIKHLRRTNIACFALQQVGATLSSLGLPMPVLGLP